MKRYSHLLRMTLNGALLAGGLLQAAISYADDTEIFFGGALAEEGVRPNVLFLLDNSGSMDSRPPGQSTGDKRLKIMKDAFGQIVNNTAGVNIGVMQFNSNSGSRLSAEVDYIDGLLGDTDIVNYTEIFSVASSADDASQAVASSSNALGGNSLIIGGSSDQIVGLRFQDLPIPRNATITSARLVFSPSADHSDAVMLKVLPEQSGNPLAYTETTSGRLSERSVDNSAFLTWEPDAWQADIVPDENQDVVAQLPSVDVTAQLQSIVNRSDWCGNNSAAFQIRTESGTGMREFHSFDSESGDAPQLVVEWEASAVTGCLNPIVELQVALNNADGVQSGTSGNAKKPVLNGQTLSFNNSFIAARFEGVQIPKDATIMDARLFSTSESGSARNRTARVSIENSVTPTSLSTGDYNFSSRKRIDSISCDFQRAPATELTNSCSLTAQIQTLVKKDSWSASNRAIVALIRPDDDGISLIAHDKSPAQSMRLRIKFQGSALRTYRENLVASVNKMTANGWTPIVPTMLDAAKYLRDQSRSPITSACQPTHMVLLSDGEAKHSNNNNTPSVDITSLASIGSATTCAGSGAEKCGRELAKYLAESDQAGWIEDANNYITTHTIGFALGASSFDPKTCAFSGNASDSKRAAKFLCEIAENGGGGYYSADNATELTNAFNEIIRSVIATDASFVSASAPVNSFNRLDNRDELYFAVFRPQETDRWPGNLKRYKLDVDGERILDAAGSVAVDTNTGFFSSTARSFWSAEVDGNQTSLGGAASKLPAPGSRNLYTFTGDNPNNANLTKVTTATNLNTHFGLGTSSSDITERQKLINYLLGWEGGVANSTQRKSIGDPLHSSPRLVTYKANDSAVVIGTNEGMIHVINTENGVEDLAFMPKALLGNVKELMANGPSSVDNRRPYGMDNTVTLWANDVNRNGSILNDNGTAETGEFVYAYATMGRGGRNLYALDLTNRSAPKLLWEIIGGTTTGFENLGQTWSAPVRTKIQIGSASADNPPTDVLVFAGGYDEGQDAQPEGDTNYTRREDTMGNALYIVNAKTGELIWSATGDVDDDDGNFYAAMKYSIPSPVRVIDLQQNAAGQLVYDSTRTADQIFVGDMGGQIWRFIINNGESGDDLVSGGVMAELGGDGVNARRFYHAPDVALVKGANGLKLAVNIGSGYRGHPLHKIIQDRFYSVQTTALTSSDDEVFTEDDLADLTSVLTEEGTSEALADKQGWMIKLGDDGEKVLSAALTVNNVIYFNTYEPTARQGSCQANVGLNRAYSVKLSNAMPIRNSGDVDSSGRYVNVNTSGLLPDPVVVTIGGKNVLVRFPSIEGIDDEPEPSNFWIDITADATAAAPNEDETEDGE